MNKSALSMWHRSHFVLRSGKKRKRMMSASLRKRAQKGKEKKRKEKKRKEREDCIRGQ
jgi:hypothetical protein